MKIKKLLEISIFKEDTCPNLKVLNLVGIKIQKI